MTTSAKQWDAAGYESNDRFVWEYGKGVLSLLAPREGERILDVGCGTGHLTGQMAEAGALPHGIDASPAMIAQARQNFPKLSFQLVDASQYESGPVFDAAFSNAALHWMPDASGLVRAVARALKPGGRFVGEMGGKGNITAISIAIRSEIKNYFPSVSEYSEVLERNGFEVTMMTLFDRPTPLENGEKGLREWIEMFRGDNTRPVEEVEAELRPRLFRDGRWVADYRRLRFVAVRIGS
jgi:trans-aconitate methyltransferase